MKKLALSEIRAAQTALPDWRRRGAVIAREFAFRDFVMALKFVNAVGRAAERAQHHPDIDIRWNRVRLALTTHDAGGLTARDFALAAQCDRLAAKAG
jgi:4a-hydroxytetrahydrobiopterin dehydratase